MTGSGGEPARVIKGLSSGYTPPGPICNAYIQSREPRPFIMGPEGSGKTAGSFIRGLVATSRQPLHRIKRKKVCKIIAVVDTYRNAWDKLIPSYIDVFPKEAGKWTGGKGEPADHIIENEQMLMHWSFRAVGEASLDSFRRGLQPTCIYLYEIDLLPDGVLNALFGRLGRYPSAQDLDGDVYRSMWGDFNAPNASNPVWKRLFLNPQPGDALFVQPSGLAPNAENVQNLPRDYYKLKIESADDEMEIKRMVENLPGYSRDGKPVYARYRDDLHSPRAPIAIDRGVPVIIGVDGGLKAGAAFGQVFRTGNLNILDEVATPPDEADDAFTFGEKVKHILATRFKGMPAIAVVDPANNAQNAANQDKISWLKNFQQTVGIPCLLAPTNAIEARLNAVRRPLRKLGNGGRPLLQVDRRCVETREGFTLGYKLKKKPHKNEWADVPDKNAHASHLADAVQYLALGAFGLEDAIDLALMAAGRTLNSRHIPQSHAPVPLEY